jgi:hypothetical protein
MDYLTKDHSLAVLRTAKEGGYLETIPDEDKEIIELAKFYVEQAEKEYKSSAKMRRDKTVKEILGIKSAAISDKSEKAWDQFAGYNEPENKIEDNLPIPKNITKEPSEMPDDLTALSDREIRKLHGEYNAYLVRARWLLATTTTNLANYTHLRDDAYRKNYLKFSKELSESGERATKDLVDSFAKEDQTYLDYDKSVREAQDVLSQYKALVEIYSGNVDRLSREWTMRQNEWERAR